MIALDSGSVVSVSAMSKEALVLNYILPRNTMLMSAWPRPARKTGIHGTALPTMEHIANIGPACLMTDKPEPRVVVDHPLLSKNGKRLPLAAFSYEELSRRFWSQGKTLYETERKRAQELLPWDKPIEEQTLDELCTGDAERFARELRSVGSQGIDIAEPLQESRRAWLELGAKALHLQPDDGDDEGSLEDSITFVCSDETVATYDDIGDERNQQHFGTAYVITDPITAKQIDWEKRVRFDGQLRTLKITDGKIKPDKPFPTMDEFIRVGQRALALILPTAGEGPRPKLSEERVRDLCRKFDAFVANTVDYANIEAEKEWHGHWMDTEGMITFHGSPEYCREAKCPRHGEAHAHGVNRALSLEEQKYGPYHAVPQDRAELAIFDATDSDESVEAMMGADPCPGTDDSDCEGWIMRPDPFARETDDVPVCNVCGQERPVDMQALAIAI